jgi:type IV pilus assembly protein PilB
MDEQEKKQIEQTDDVDNADNTENTENTEQTQEAERSVQTKEQKDQQESDAGGDSDALVAQAADLGVKPLVEMPTNANRVSVQTLSEDIARKHRMVIFDKDKKTNTLHVAMMDVRDVDALNILRFIAQKDRMNIEIYLTNEQLLDNLYSLYGSAEKAVEDVVTTFEIEGENKKDTLNVIGDKESIQDAPVAKLVHVIIKHALDGKASDIHIEPIDKTYRVRFRQDGILHSSLTFPLEVGKAVISRIKILSNLKIDERRKPQDGRFRINDKGNDIDFRVSSLPVVEGEKIVMRVLEKDRQTFDLKELGLMGTQYEMFLERIKDPYGMILMTGPTGSGKSTTLYAFLKILNQEERNIITLEDPVEYFVPGINQSQVKPEIGYTFASGLRSILRQDPNVIMVGEIRDGETAQLGVHAALTGHLVFSTVHTNNAIGALPRLIDLGIEPFLIASAVRVIAAQRLVRRICEDCKEEAHVPENVVERIREELVGVSEEELKKYGLDLSGGMKFHKGKGCKKCGGLGLKGRLALYEAIEVDTEIQNLIVEEDGNASRVEKLARSKGFITLKQDGIMKMLLGMTTLAELERITEGDMSIGGKIDEVTDEEQMQNDLKKNH